MRNIHDRTYEVLTGLTKKKYSRRCRVYGVKHHLIAVINDKVTRHSWTYKCPYCNKWYSELTKHVNNIHNDKTSYDLVRDFWEYDEYPKCYVCGEDIPIRSLNQMGPRIYGLFCHSTCTAMVKAEFGINPLQLANRPKNKNGEDIYKLKGDKTKLKIYGSLNPKFHSKYGFDSTWEDAFWDLQKTWDKHCKRMTETIPYKGLDHKFHSYYPDFIFRHVRINGKPIVIEIKSIYTYNMNPELVELKLKACAKKGYSIIMVDLLISDGKYWSSSLKDLKRIWELEQSNLKKYSCMIPEYNSYLSSQRPSRDWEYTTS